MRRTWRAPLCRSTRAISVEASRVTGGGWGEAFVQAGGSSAPHVRPVEARTGFFNRAVDEVEADLRERVVTRISGVL